MSSPNPVDALGVEINVGDLVRVTAWGAPVRLTDTGRTAKVTGFSRTGNVVLSDREDFDPIANGRSVRPGYLAVQRRDGEAGHEGNVGRKDV